MARAHKTEALFGEIIARLDRGDMWKWIMADLDVSRSQISRARKWNRSVDGPDVDRPRSWQGLIA